MTRTLLLTGPALCCMMLAAAAQGPANPLLGAWSSQFPAANGGGIIATTTIYQPDGTFVSTGRLPSGTLTRLWGQYRVEQVGPSQWRLESQLTGFLPQQWCASVPGGATTCRPNQMGNMPQTEMMTFNGPNTVVDGGVTMMRDPNPVLAQMQVPAVAMQTVAPAPGMVQGPVATVHPYTTPNGTRYNSQPAQDFIYQRLRGCRPDYGTLHSYTNCQ